MFFQAAQEERLGSRSMLKGPGIPGPGGGGPGHTIKDLQSGGEHGGPGRLVMGDGSQPVGIEILRKAHEVDGKFLAVKVRTTIP